MPGHKPRNDWLVLPPGWDPIDCTIDEAMAYRRLSRTAVLKKIHDGVYQTYRDGKRRKIVFATVKADRMRALLADQRREKTGKRKVGRPRQPRPDQQPTPAGE
jgi:hypothetical protein